MTAPQLHPSRCTRSAQEPQKIDDGAATNSTKGQAPKGEGNITVMFSMVPAWIWMDEAANREAETKKADFLLGKGLSPLKVKALGADQRCAGGTKPTWPQEEPGAPMPMGHDPPD